MEKLRFIADTDWQSNVDGRPSISLQIAFTTSNPQLSSSASFLRLNVLSSLN